MSRLEVKTAVSRKTLEAAQAAFALAIIPGTKPGRPRARSSIEY